MQSLLSILVVILSSPVSSPGHHYQEEDLPKVQPLNYRLPHIPTKPPSFLGPSSLNLTGSPGSTIVLPCRVMSLGSASLSWLRRPQLTVLSSGTTLFSSSPRLRLLHYPGSPDWNLQLGPLLPQDEGTYECQVNTEPKQSRIVTLNIDTHGPGPGPALALQGDIGPEEKQRRTEILAPDHMKVDEGGTASLECVVTEHEVAPAYFTWYILGTPLDFSNHRGGILLQTEKKRRSSSSRLTITRMSSSDSGVYTCSPVGSGNRSVTIQVVNKHRRHLYQSGVGRAVHPYHVGMLVMGSLVH